MARVSIHVLKTLRFTIWYTIDHVTDMFDPRYLGLLMVVILTDRSVLATLGKEGEWLPLILKGIPNFMIHVM